MSEVPLTGVLVTGVGRVAVRPDVLVARLGVQASGASVQEALDRASAAMTAMAGALREAGVADRDRQTAGASISQRYDHGEPTGWTASQQLTAQLRDLGTAGEFISKAVEAAGDEARMDSVNFDVDDDTVARGEARRKAFADAQARAVLYAGLAGRRLGSVVAVREADAGFAPAPMMRGFAVAESVGMPVEQGELEVTATVEVRWAFVD